MIKRQMSSCFEPFTFKSTVSLLLLPVLFVVVLQIIKWRWYSGRYRICAADIIKNSSAQGECLPHRSLVGMTWVWLGWTRSKEDSKGITTWCTLYNLRRRTFLSFFTKQIMCWKIWEKKNTLQNEAKFKLLKLIWYFWTRVTKKSAKCSNCVLIYNNVSQVLL